jgi:soluble lytic murein transglycosylase-like protein
MAFILGSIFLIVTLLLAIKPEPAGRAATSAAQETTEETTSSQPATVNAGDGAISSLFAAPVQHWAPQITTWADAYGLDPNLVATIMQVESCGDPRAVSSAGARGLFQVMPFHFQPGEDGMDPDTNARRGLTYFVERLEQTGGDVGQAFAGYNGGQRAAANSWERWPAETRRYFLWTTGIYNEVQQDNEESPTLQRWLQAGGAGLCRQAAERLELGR